MLQDLVDIGRGTSNVPTGKQYREQLEISYGRQTIESIPKALEDTKF